jgi:hypothetical protein
MTDSVIINTSSAGGNMQNLQNSIILGSEAGISSQNGSTIIIGYRAAQNGSGTSRNIAIGSEALKLNLLGDYNTVIGHRSGFNLNSSENTFIGAHAGELTTSTQITSIGTFAGQNSGSSSLFAGYRAGVSGGVFSVGLGAQALENSTSANSVAIGYNAGASSTAPLLAIGSGAGQFSTASGIFLGTGTGANNSGVQNIAVGNGIGLTTGAGNVLIGENQSYSVQPSNSVCLGAGNTGSSSIFLTVGAGSGSSTNSIHLGNSIATNAPGASSNIICGFGTATNSTNMQNSIIMGNTILASSTGTTGAIILGNESCSSATFVPSNNIAIGYRALKSGPASGSQNISIGTESQENISGTNMISLGYRSFRNSGNQSIGIGNNISTSGATNVIFGNNSQGNDQSITIGHNLINNSSSSIFCGVRNGTTTGLSNIVVGSDILANSGNANLITGQNIFFVNGDNNIVQGSNIQDVTSSASTIIGNNIGQNRSNSAVVIGSQLSGLTNVSLNNTVMGSNIGSNINFGNFNTILGNAVSSTVATANPFECVIIGRAGFSAGGIIQNSVAIGSNARVGASNNVQILDGTATNTGSIRFQSQQISTGTWIGGGLTTASIDNGGNIIRTVSDVRLKKKIKPLKEALKKIMELKPVSYYFKDPNISKKKEFGLIAQDLIKVFPNLVNSASQPFLSSLSETEKEKGEDENYLSVNYLPLIAVLIQSIQELYGLFLENQK